MGFEAEWIEQALLEDMHEAATREIAAAAEVYRVKVRLTSESGGAASAASGETFLADCPSSPAGRALGWIERNCRRLPASDITIHFNPPEITISKPVR